jgi:hypothetical protein
MLNKLFSDVPVYRRRTTLVVDATGTMRIAGTRLAEPASGVNHAGAGNT